MTIFYYDTFIWSFIVYKGFLSGIDKRSNGKTDPVISDKEY